MPDLDDRLRLHAERTVAAAPPVTVAEARRLRRGGRVRRRAAFAAAAAVAFALGAGVVTSNGGDPPAGRTLELRPSDHPTATTTTASSVPSSALDRYRPELRRVLDADAACSQPSCTTPAGLSARADGIAVVVAPLEKELRADHAANKMPAADAAAFLVAREQLQTCFMLSASKHGESRLEDCRGPIRDFTRAVEQLRALL